MKILEIAFKELIGMFIDDDALAVLSLGLIIVIGIATKTGYLGGLTGAILLFVGCLLILAESVARAARKKFAEK
jgi:hypothetical protein